VSLKIIVGVIYSLLFHGSIARELEAIVGGFKDLNVIHAGCSVVMLIRGMNRMSRAVGVALRELHVDMVEFSLAMAVVDVKMSRTCRYSEGVVAGRDW
jgi:hypothetical protein